MLTMHRKQFNNKLNMKKGQINFRHSPGGILTRRIRFEVKHSTKLLERFKKDETLNFGEVKMLKTIKCQRKAIQTVFSRKA